MMTIAYAMGLNVVEGTWSLNLFAEAVSGTRESCWPARLAHVLGAHVYQAGEVGRKGGRDIVVEQDSDQALIRACLSQDGEQFAELVRRYESAVAGILWRFTRNPQVLEELAQDTFVEVYFSLRRFRSDAPFFPWLRAIATRVGYRYWRSQRREAERRARASEYLRPEPKDPSDTAEYVYHVLESLPPKDRLVLTLHYFEGCSTKEIAARMGWTATLVTVRAFRARKRLRALLSETEAKS